MLFNTFDTALCEIFSDAYTSSGYLSPSGLANQFRNFVVQTVCLDQFLQRDVHPIAPIMV